MEYSEVKEQIKQKLPMQKEFGDSENLLELGLSSIVIMRLVNQWRKQGVKVAFGTLMEHPTLNEWWESIQKSMRKKERKSNAEKREKMPERDMWEPFPLTDVQYAYWAGREDGQPLGGIGCHAYLEFDGNNVEAVRLEAAWNQLQYHHPMLRACFTEDGRQKIQERPFSEKMPVNDFSDMPEKEAYKKAEEVRERLSHRKLQIEKGEVAGIELTLLPSGKNRIHIDMDLLIADVQSLQILLKDLVAAYNGKKLPEESKDWNFAAYLERQAVDDNKEKAKDYWRKRLDTLPKGPELPLAKRPEEVEKTVFHRRIVRIEKKEWEELQSKAKEYQTTPAMLLLTAYATVLERWSRNKRFLINIPFFNRKTEYQGMEEVIADFTTLLLLEVDCENNPTFLELLGRIQKRLHEDMKYTAYSGVQVQRDLTKKYGDASASAPVVFACNLGTPLVNEEFKETLGTFSYMISQTPQVWNDFQSYEDEDGVQLTWDSVDALFPDSMVQDMMDSFQTLLHRLRTENWDQEFDVLPENRRKFLGKSYNVGELEQPMCLHTAFLQNAAEHPGKIALVDTGEGCSITYGDFKEKALEIAAEFFKHGIRKEPIAITLPHRREQIVAAMGILMSGNIYVPVSISQPRERRKLIHEKTGVKYVITNKKWKDMIEWPDKTKIFMMDEMKESSDFGFLKISPEDSAYIIMTSGSTGVPKGVEIAHKSAWNTIQDINKKYRVSEKDTALAISAMDFDLSVYDVFGVLGSGGTLVLIPEEERKNAEYWMEQIVKYHVTIWNSVPVLLDMLCVCAEARKEKLPLRVVMISGDWIGMDLPERIASLTDYCEFVAMGGATEASIWSNYQEVTLPIPSEWKSIPYGRPLEHQAYRVVDENGKDCPYWAEGELWIGGCGVAKGYRGDFALTEQKFVSDTFGRWYKTGDLGRFWQDGTIEFLGRKDHQIKIRGHRIEIGEIEACINSIDEVDDSIVACIKENLIGFYSIYKDDFEEKNKEILHQRNIINIEQKRVNDLGVILIMELLLKEKCFLKDEEQYTYSELKEKCNISNRYQELFRVWLNILISVGKMKYEDARYCCKESLVKKFEEKVKYIEEYSLSSLILKKLYNALNDNKKILYDIIQGKVEPTKVLVDYKLIPSNLESTVMKDTKYFAEIEGIIERLTASLKRKIKILEIGGYSTDIINVLDSQKGYAIETYTYLVAKNKQFKGHGDYGFPVEIVGLDINDEMFGYWCNNNVFDLVIAHQSLHCSNNVNRTIYFCTRMLKKGGILINIEPTWNSYFFITTLGFLENKFGEYTDMRRGKGELLFSKELWSSIAIKAGLIEKKYVEYDTLDKKVIFIWEKAKEETYITQDKIKEILKQKLPSYMMPDFLVEIDKIPISLNGKKDRKKVLQYLNNNELFHRRGTLAETDVEIKLVEGLKEILDRKMIFLEDNFFQLGGDSLRAMKLKNYIVQKFGINVSIAQIFESRDIKELVRKIEETIVFSVDENNIMGEI